MELVVDASVAVKWFVPESHAATAREILSREVTMHAPDLLQAEVTGVLCKKIQGRQLNPDEGREALDAFFQLPIQFHPTADFLLPAFEIALESRQYVYDCVYLMLAAQLDIRMLTADRHFFKAMQKTKFSNHIGWIEHALVAGGARGE